MKKTFEEPIVAAVPGDAATFLGNEKAAGAPFTKTTWGEATWVAVFLVCLFFLRLWSAIRLQHLGAFDQFDLFFDADPISYIPAMTHGWSFGRSVHPGFAVLLNVPARAIDAAMAFAGITKPGIIRQFIAVAMAPFFGSLSGLFWWLAARRANFSQFARTAGLVFFQFAFSQTVFSVVPESYALSGCLFAVLLLFTVDAAQRPASLQSRTTRIRWLFLACLMSAITVTNGFLCVTIWMAVRFDRTILRRVILEGFVAAAVVVCNIAAWSMADAVIYNLKVTAASRNESVSNWTKRFTNNEPLVQGIAIPSAFINSAFPTRIDRVPRMETAFKARYDFQLSVEPVVKLPLSIFFGWIILGGVFLAAWRDGSLPAFARALGMLGLLNGLLHSVFGREVFLYSQHWLGFLTFAMVLPLSRAVSLGSRAAILSLAGLALFSSSMAWARIIAELARQL